MAKKMAKKTGKTKKTGKARFKFVFIKRARKAGKKLSTSSAGRWGGKVEKRHPSFSIILPDFPPPAPTKGKGRK